MSENNRDSQAALTPAQIAWRDQQQELMLHRLRQYRQAHGDLLVPSDHRDDDGYMLGARVRFLRRSRGETLSDQTLQQLKALGFVWDVREARWQRAVDELRAFIEEHGHGDPRVNHVTESGFRLGQWLSNFRKRLDQQPARRVTELKELGARLDWDQWLRDH